MNTQGLGAQSAARRDPSREGKKVVDANKLALQVQKRDTRNPKPRNLPGHHNLFAITIWMWATIAEDSF